MARVDLAEGPGVLVPDEAADATLGAEVGIRGEEAGDPHDVRGRGGVGRDAGRPLLRTQEGPLDVDPGSRSDHHTLRA